MMRLAVTGAGAWGRGVRCAADIGREVAHEDDVPVPRPAVIPKRELRRSPNASRLAVEVAVQACEAAGQDTANIRSVFTSSLGDSAITDYMCRTLAGDDKLLSPTRFHNSVHNAAAGCWSIACNNPLQTNFVASFGNSAGLAFLEAMTLVASDARPTLFVAVDVPVPGPLASVHGNGTTAALAMVIDRENEDAAPCTVTLDASAVSTPEDHAISTRTLWPMAGAQARGEAWHGELKLGTRSRMMIDLETRRAQ